MDYENISGPMYCDFESLQQGLDVDEGDEWFDRKLEEMETGVSLGVGGDSFLQETNKECVPDVHTENESSKKMSTTTNVNKTGEPSTNNEDKNKMFNKMFVSNVATTEVVKRKTFRTTQKKNLPGRNAALKATKSISAMYKQPKQSSTTATTTIPTTPKLMKRYQNRVTPKNTRSTEELEMEKIHQLKADAKKKKELAKESFKRMKTKTTPAKLPLKAVKPTTQAVGFEFKTTARLKGKDATKEGNSKNVFPMNLRSSDNNSSRPGTPRDVTHVKPFKFMTEERLQQRKRHYSADQKYVSTAEFIDKFQKTTPPRFRTKIPDDITTNMMIGGSSKDYSTELTNPKTPNLSSRHRSRPVKVISKAEQEQKEVEEMKKYQFKANPVKANVLRAGGDLGVPKPMSQPVTEAVSPFLATKERFSAKRGREEMEKEEKKEFKAMPIPRNILKKVTGVPEKQTQDVTVPLSPGLSKRRKVLDDKEKEPVESKPVCSTAFKPLPMPDFSTVFKPAVDHAHTQPQPFSFEDKYPNRDEVIKNLIEKDDEEFAKKRDFHANPLPDLDNPAPLPPKPHPHKTQVKPFELNTEKRIDEHLTKFHHKIQLEREEEQKKHDFHATENKSLSHSKPYEPLKSSKPLTETNNIILHTALRREERLKYDDEKTKREEERIAEEERKKALDEAQEEERVKALRRSLVHKALPIHDYGPIHIKKSSKPLTKPRSPELVYKTRSTRTATSAVDDKLS